MYYSVSVDHKHMAGHVTRSNCERFEEVLCIECHGNGTNDDMLWNGSEEVENARSECEEDEGNDCKDGYSNINW